MKLNRSTRTLIALVFVLFAAYISGEPLSSILKQTPEETIAGVYPVVRIADGDTITVSRDGKDVTVRMIGIDTPEVKSSYTKAECFGGEASAEAKRLLTGASVRVQTDPTQDTYDAYDRLLAYVYVQRKDAPELLFNEYMVRNGYAREYTYRDAYQYRDLFLSAERAAKNETRGLWNGATCPQ